MLTAPGSAWIALLRRTEDDDEESTDSKNNPEYQVAGLIWLTRGARHTADPPLHVASHKRTADPQQLRCFRYDRASIYPENKHFLPGSQSPE